MHSAKIISCSLSIFSRGCVITSFQIFTKSLFSFEEWIVALMLPHFLFKRKEIVYFYNGFSLHKIAYQVRGHQRVENSWNDSCSEYFQDDSLGNKNTDGLRLLVKVCIEVKTRNCK